MMTMTMFIILNANGNDNDDDNDYDDGDDDDNDDDDDQGAPGGQGRRGLPRGQLQAVRPLRRGRGELLCQK